MDLTDTIQPNSDQLDAVDLLAGPRIFTIAKVTVNPAAEQPVNIYLAEHPKPWRPGKSMRRVMVACWGADANEYVGRLVELYCDPDVRFGGQAVGGTRIRRLSHIDRPRKIPLLVARGKSAIYTVEPLDPPPPNPKAEAEAETGEVMSEGTRKRLFALFGEREITDRDEQIRGIVAIIGREITSRGELTEAEAQAVIERLAARS